MTIEGLIAPEGVYTMTSSYVLPPQPSFMTALPTSSSLAPMSNVPTTSTNSAQTQSANTGSTQMAQSSSNNTNLSPNVPTNSGSTANATPGTLQNQSPATPSTLITNSTSPQFEQALFSPNGTGLSSQNNQPKTALHHISIQAPSAWSHVAIIPPSRISIASVRYPPSQQSQPISSLSRKERQQQSQASNTQSLAAPPLDGSADGSGSSNSDLGVGMDNSVLSESNYATGGDIHRRNTISSIQNWGPVLEATLASQGIDGLSSHVTGGAGGLPGMSALQLLSHLGGAGTSEETNNLSLFSSGQPNVFNSAASYANANKNLPKPKNNIKQTSSSFVQRLQMHSDLAKLIASRLEGTQIERHAFVSRSRMLFWLGETSTGWIKDPLSRLTFASPITSHDVNQQTRSPNRLDVIISFKTSDLIWLEAISMRYSRINKSGCINDAPITTVRWLPGSETLFLTTHNDGTCTLFDITREDSTPGSWAPISAIKLDLGSSEGQEEEQEVLMAQNSTLEGDQQQLQEGTSTTSHSIHPWESRTGILVTRPARTGNETQKKAWMKLNPVAHWRIARKDCITDMAFSPDHTRLALVSTDGSLRLLNLLTESLEGTFQSYYGALNRVIWSPDAKFLLTAGCDDLISIWTSDGRLLSRCPGHSSFVTGIAFDPWKWKVEDRTYRFISVGEDGRVFLWDFSSAALHRPRMPHSAHSARRSAGAHQQSSASLHVDHLGRRGSAGTSIKHHGTTNEENHAHGQPAFRRAPPRAEVAELQPVASYNVGVIPIAQNSTTNDTVNVIPFVITSLPGQGSSQMTTSISTSANESSATQTTSNGGSATNNTASTPNSAPPTNANEPGSALDLLVDVRCRPDGILLMHKSGTLRYLHRPFMNGSMPQKIAAR